MRQAFSVVHIPISGEAAEQGLSQQRAQQMPRIPDTAALRQRAAGQIGQPKRIVQFPPGQQAGVGRDAAAVEVGPEAAFDIEPRGAVNVVASRP